jgi:hypothetical protein
MFLGLDRPLFVSYIKAASGANLPRGGFLIERGDMPDKHDHPSTKYCAYVRLMEAGGRTVPLCDHPNDKNTA